MIKILYIKESNNPNNKNNYGLAEVDSFAKLPLLIDNFRTVLKVFRPEEGLSYEEFKMNEYDLDKHTIVIQTLEDENDCVLPSKKAIIEEYWIRDYIASMTLMGRNYFNRVYLMSEEGITLEEFLLQNRIEIEKELTSKINNLNEYMSEIIEEHRILKSKRESFKKDMANLMKKRVNQEARLEMISNINYNISEVCEKLSAVENKLNYLNDELNLCREYIITLPQN